MLILIILKHPAAVCNSMIITAENFFTYIMPINIYLLVTMLFALWKLDKKKTDNKLLLTVLIVMVVTEVISVLLQITGYTKGISILYNLSMPIHNVLWLYILYRNINMKLLTKFLAIVYLLFVVATNLFRASLSSFNDYIMIVGAFIYLVIFIIESFNELQKENFTFFTSNMFLLLFSPILFFLGLSIGFGFHSSELIKKEVFGFELYHLIVHFVSIVYYTFINIYVYKENKIRSGE
jgi:hypothetical protein